MIETMQASSSSSALVNVDMIRASQTRRVEASLASWEQAKEQLRNAIALVETRERDFQEISADVKAKLSALDLVVSLAGGAPVQPGVTQLTAAAPADTMSLPSFATVPSDGMFRLFTRSRNLVSPKDRAALAAMAAGD